MKVLVRCSTKSVGVSTRMCTFVAGTNIPAVPYGRKTAALTHGDAVDARYMKNIGLNSYSLLL